MNETELQDLKTFLQQQKGLILNKTQEFKTQDLASLSSLSDEAEAASRDLTMNVSIHLHERDRASLFQIERALSKITAGTYGLCESCGDEIENRRLKARPFTTLCIHCMEEHEDPRRLLN